MIEAVRLDQGDALDYLQDWNDESIDLVITDPPYESLNKHRTGSEKCRRLKKWFDTAGNDYIIDCAAEIYRILKTNSHFYVFCDVETMFEIKDRIEEIGFKFWKPLIWDKVSIGTGYHYRSRYELVLFFEKGKRRLKDLSMPDVLQCQQYKGRNRYPTEKPAMLIEQLVLQSSDVADIVLDPFMGSGSTGVAAVKNHRVFLGNDKSFDAFCRSSNILEKLVGDMNEKSDD